jgi:hypothetical protein
VSRNSGAEPTAQGDGVSTLYKFMQYPPPDATRADVETRRRWVRDLLLDGKLYFPRPQELNDPFEAQPNFALPKGTPKEVLAKLSKSLRQRHAPRLGWSEEMIAACERDLQEEMRSGVLEGRMAAIQEKNRKEFSTGYPLVCFSRYRDNMLLWSHYADGHGGICIHFDSASTVFALSRRVEYSHQYPEIVFPAALDDPDEVFKAALLTKSKHWQPEAEYRFINAPQNAGDHSKRVLDGIVGWEGQVAGLPDHYVVGVTVGARMPDHQIEEVARICRDRRVPIPVDRAECHSSEFSLIFKRVD